MRAFQNKQFTKYHYELKKEEFSAKNKAYSLTTYIYSPIQDHEYFIYFCEEPTDEVRVLTHTCKPSWIKPQSFASSPYL
jgi:hypothetical protein